MVRFDSGSTMVDHGLLNVQTIVIHGQIDSQSLSDVWVNGNSVLSAKVGLMTQLGENDVTYVSN